MELRTVPSPAEVLEARGVPDWWTEVHDELEAEYEDRRAEADEIDQEFPPEWRR